VEQLENNSKKKSQMVRRLVSYEELFDLVHQTHLNTSHKGRDIMKRNLDALYLNVTRISIETYLALCSECVQKNSKFKTTPKTGVVVESISSERFNQRIQIDIIDFQFMPDDGYRFILYAQDHFTKFCHLRPIKAKTVQDVVKELISIFASFGPPEVIQSQNGIEFSNTLIEDIVSLFPSIKIMHDRPRKALTRSFERLNADVKAMIGTWMQTNNSTQWSKGK
jgi:hypothetical protein